MKRRIRVGMPFTIVYMAIVAILLSITLTVAGVNEAPQADTHGIVQVRDIGELER